MRRVRYKILTKARSLFLKKGYSNVTLKDIAAAYGCKSSNLYNSFKSKEEILFILLDNEMEAILNPIRPIVNDDETDPLVQLKSILESHGRVTLNKMKTSKFLFDSNLRSLSQRHQKIIIGKRDEYDRILRAVIERGIDSGLFKRTEVKLASFAISSIMARISVWYKPSGAQTIDEIIDTVYVFTLRILGYKYLSEGSSVILKTG